MESLRGNLAESLWYLHAQPPLFNLYGAFFGRAFPDDPLAAMHYANIVLGGLSVAMLYSIAHEVTRSRALASVVGLGLAVHPALLLYEAYALYTLLASFLVVASIFLVARHQQTGRVAYLCAAILALNFLILTRSLFHLVVLLGAIPFVTLLARRQWRGVLAACLAISLLSVGWYAKNLVVFGSFSSSSWAGQGLWQVVSSRQPQDLLDELVAQGVLDPMVTRVRQFSSPSRYAEYGFDATSEIPALSRDDLHNLNIIDISRAYGDNALRLVQHSPGPFLMSVFKSYRTFVRPAADHVHLSGNAAAMPWLLAADRGALGSRAVATADRREGGLRFFPLLSASALHHRSRPQRRAALPRVDRALGRLPQGGLDPVLRRPLDRLHDFGRLPVRVRRKQPLQVLDRRTLLGPRDQLAPPPVSGTIRRPV